MVDTVLADIHTAPCEAQQFPHTQGAGEGQIDRQGQKRIFAKGKGRHKRLRVPNIPLMLFDFGHCGVLCWISRHDGIPSRSPLYSSLRFLEADKDLAGVSSPTPPLAFSPIQCINESPCADVCGQHRAIFYTSNNFETGTSSTSAILNSVSIDTPKGQAYAVSVV